MYYLQYPRTQDEVDSFAPKVKHPLQLAPTGIEDIKFGMRGAVDFGTARRAGYDATRSEEHTSELQSLWHLVCRLLLEKKKGAQAYGPGVTRPLILPEGHPRASSH